MRYKGEKFNNKKLDKIKAKNYGFFQKNNDLIFSSKLMDETFEFIFKVNENGEIDVKVIELLTGEEYELIHVPHAQGKFIGQMRDEYENILSDIADKCYVFNVFKSDYANSVISYINNKYSVEPEYLWEKFPDNAIFRDKNTQKWFAAILTVAKRKVNVEEDGFTEIIDLKAKPDFIQSLVNGKSFLPGYHMNKKHWFTIRLDGSVDINEIYEYIDLSYDTVVK